jgi:3-oxoacyl-[acyl-carrier-protein] synthase-3
MVETSDQWILDRTGIRERHIVDKGVATSDLATEAAKVTLKARGVGPEQIEAIIVGTVTPDMFFPATACLVQNKLGASKAWGFDLSAACSAFVYALQTGAQFIVSGAHKKVLVIGADTMSSIIDYKDRATCVIFGDGAGAVLLEPVEHGEDAGLIDFEHYVDGAGGCSLYMPGGGSLNPTTHETIDKNMHVVHQDGQAVFKFAVKMTEEISRRILTRHQFGPNDLDLFVSHQANRRIIEAACERLGLGLDKVIVNLDRFGNTTAGTIPLALADARASGRVKRGDLVLLASVGAGFTVGATLMRWAY